MADNKRSPRPGEKSETISSIRDTAGGWVAQALAAITGTKKSFAEMAGMADLCEIEAARIALQRSKRPDIRAFAQQMIKDHSKTSEELKSMLGAMNEPMQPPTKLSALFQILIDDLKGAGDADFDKRYIAQQRDVHRVAITLVTHYRDHGDDSALRELCKLALPVLEHHQEMAENMPEAA